MGYGWHLFAPTPELHKLQGLWPWGGEDPPPELEVAVSEAKEKLGPPPQGWHYPRLVAATPPEMIVGAGAFWVNLPQPKSPLSGFLMLSRALLKDLEVAKWRSEMEPPLARFKGTLESLVPQIGLLDPFRRGGQLAPPPKAGPEYRHLTLGAGEDLWTWAEATLTIFFWAQAMGSRREKFCHFLEMLLHTLNAPQEPGKEFARFVREDGALPELLRRYTVESLDLGPEVPIFSFPWSTLYREALRLRFNGLKGNIIARLKLQQVLKPWGLSGLLVPGPMAYAVIAPPEGRDRGGKVYGLASAFHAALLELLARIEGGALLACEHCGSVFLAERPRSARYCSDTCRVQANREKKRRQTEAAPM